MRGAAITILIILAWVSGVNLHAQQRLHYNQYILNPYIVNPAFGGSERFTDIKAGFQSQWLGFDGAPRGVFLTAHSQMMKRMTYPRPLPLPSRSQSQIQAIPEPADIETPPIIRGIGATIVSETSGPQSVTEVSGSYTAHFQLSNQLKLGIGTNVGMLNFTFDPTSIFILDNNDIAFTSAYASVWMINVNGGALLYHPKFYGGVSLRQLLQNKLILDLSSTRKSALVLHYYFMGGCKLPVGEKLLLIPSAIVNLTAGAPPSVDIGARIIYRQLLMAGLGYRHGEGATALAGFRISDLLSLGYSYEYPLTTLRAQSSGTHSLILGLRLTKQGYAAGNNYFWQ